MPISQSGWRSSQLAKNIAIALCALLPAAGAHAADAGDPMFSFSGFGTFGVVHSSEHQADYISNIFEPNGAGFTHSWSANIDSRIGAQLNANFTPQLSAVVQVISEQNYDKSYRPHIEWANIKYQFTPDFSVRAGRIVLDTYLYSDSRKVGYTAPWAHPPLEVYNINPATSNNGADISYRMHLGEVTNTVLAAGGWNDVKLPGASGAPGTMKGRHSLAISDTAEYGPLTVHASFYKTRLSVASLQPLPDALRLFGPQGIALADKYYAYRIPAEVAVVGASYDPGQWFVMSEWGALNSASVGGKRNTWYASGGYRFGKFTPYVTYAAAKAGKLSDPGLTLSALPPALAGPAAMLNAGLNESLRRKPVQNTLSVGGRWDFMKNADLKLQFDHTDIGAGSVGTLVNFQPGFRPGGKFNLFTLVVDFVF